jgi:ATP/ADP translocase
MQMNLNKWIRDIHRWLSVAFTLAVIVNIVALVQKTQAVWIGMLALIPLIVMLLTGLYLFTLPYVAKWRTRKFAEMHPVGMDAKASS